MTRTARGVLIAGIAVALTAVAIAALWRPGADQIAPPQKLTIAVSQTYLGSGLVFIAAARGYFADEGLEVTLQPHTSGRDALAAALEKRADMGTVGDTPVMFAMMRGVPVSIVASIFTAGGAHGIVARRDRGIATLVDLAGKTVGATLGTDGHFMTSVLLAGHGQALDAVRIVGFKPEELAAALLSGRVDAIASWEPWLHKAAAAAGENGIVFRSNAGFQFGFHLAGRKEWVKANPVAVQRLLKALLRAQKFLADSPEQAMNIILDASKTDRSLLDAVGPSYRFRVTLTQSLLIMLDDQARWAIRAGLVDRRDVPNMLDAIHLDALKSVRPDAVSVVN